MLRFNQRPDAPPDGFRYMVPQTGHVIRGLDRDTWLMEIKNHLRMNSIPIPDDLLEQAEDQCCKLMPPGWCHYTDGSQPQDFIDQRLTVDDVLRGTFAMGEIMARRAAALLVPSWSPFVDQELAESRAQTCSSCYAKVPVQGCLSCLEFTGKVGAIIGDRHTRADATLEIHACGICKCSAKAQVHVKAEILARGVDDAMLAKFALIPHCWKGKEISALTEDTETSSPAL